MARIHLNNLGFHTPIDTDHFLKSKSNDRRYSRVLISRDNALRHSSEEVVYCGILLRRRRLWGSSRVKSSRVESRHRRINYTNLDGSVPCPYGTDGYTFFILATLLDFLFIFWVRRKTRALFAFFLYKLSSSSSPNNHKTDIPSCM